jgi:polyisoprenoid-binding protein YceI
MFRTLVFSVLVFAQSAWVQASTPSTQKWLVNLDQGSGAVEFDATGRPSALKIRGKGAAPRGSLTLESNMASGSLSFELDTLDTGIKLRNQHMKEKYLETAKYSKATLTITKLSIPDAIKGETAKFDKLPFEGTLSLHGVEKPITGNAKVERNGKLLNVDADLALKISDYGIATPGFAGITMAEDVKILVRFSAPVVTN